MTTLLTFLGTGRYETVTYTWQGKAAQPTNLFPIAANELFAPERVIVFVTEAAEQYHPPKGEKCPTCNQVLPDPKEERSYIEQLREQLGDALIVTRIPDGRSESELWKIFDQVVGAVEQGDTVILDITHAFRSIPMIVFAGAAYLRRTKSVTFKHVIYGAFEARDKEKRAPIFDLTPLVDLLDWLNGAEFMLRRSDAILLAERLEQTHQRIWSGSAGDELPRKLQSLGRALSNLSQALHLARPRDVMKAAHSLIQLLNAVEPEVERWAKPFGVILEQVRSEAAKFARDKPDQLDKENLQKQLVLIKHYLNKGLIMQAVSLAREWIVSWVALQRDEGDWLDERYREFVIEEGLGAAAKRLQPKVNVEVPKWFDELPESERIAKEWDWITKLRNDVAHCGMRRNAADINSIKRRAEEIPQRLEGLLENVPDKVLYGGRVVIDLSTFYEGTAQLEDLPQYVDRARELAGEGNEVVLTGQAPIWLYLAVTHALHSKVRKLLYNSPVTGEVLIFDHTAR